MGADANIMDEEMISEFKKANLEFKLVDLPQQRVFDRAASLPNGQRASLICSKVATVDTELHVWHWTALILRMVRWLVTNQMVGEPLLGRPVLEELDLNTRIILAVAADKHSGIADVSSLLEEDRTPPTGRVARILEGVYHPEGGADSFPQIL